jgi:hypothetical protein
MTESGVNEVNWGVGHHCSSLQEAIPPEGQLLVHASIVDSAGAVVRAFEEDLLVMVHMGIVDSPDVAV